LNKIFDPYVSANRLLQITSPLGADVLMLYAIEGHEQISGLFEFELTVFSKRDQLSAPDIVGRPVDFVLKLDDEGQRTWNGIVTQVTADGHNALGMRVFRLSVRPFLWMLTQTSDCRIVHGKTTQDITALYLIERGFDNFLFKLVNPLPVRDYCVQYNETAFTYLTRLWEEDGLFWWFEHERGRHTLVIADSPTTYTDAPNPAPKLVLQAVNQDEMQTDLHDWHEAQRFISGVRTAQDWNFEQPVHIVTGGAPSLFHVANNSTYELYEYPGRALTSDLAKNAATFRMHALEAEYDRVTAQCFIRTLAPGLRFTPRPYPEGSVFEPYVVTRITHHAAESSYVAGEQKPAFYNGEIAAIPARLPATPHRLTPRPRVDGVQMAVVFGPPGEEIYTDQYGRIQVRFPWDRRGDISCWMRVVQPWGGAGWGAQVIPRVGMEVAVSYQDGDPDRPMCVGAVVNPDNMSAYLLPTRKTRMVFRSKTYKAVGYNEFSMEDATGNEEYFMHAQKDMNTKVRNNASVRVDVNAVESVGLNKGVEVDNNMTQVVAGDLSIAVGPSGKGRLVSPAATTLATGVGRSAYSLGDPQSAAIGSGNFSVSVEQNMSESILQDRTEKVTGNKDSNVLQNYTVEVGQVMTINAQQRIVLQSGQSQIVLEADGTILISGQVVNVTGKSMITHSADVIKMN
jgi:type VI secretion system secreted protein VgrG